MPLSSFRRAVAKIVLRALLALFLVPVVTWGFALWFMHDTNRDYQAQAADAVARSRLSDGEKQAAAAFYARVAPSSTCYGDAPDLAAYRAQICPRYSALWQFALAERTAFFTVLANIGLLALLLLLGALAFHSRGLQSPSFLVGWRLLMLASAVQVIVQGACLVWLSFWLTAHFMHEYSPKLIIAVGLLVLLAAGTAVVAIFRRAREDNRIDGELVTPDQAPGLWARLRNFAARLETDPPTQIVAGIDANFFVTEVPLRLGDRVLRGRTLFVSLPLLRQLDNDEANAVLAHELGHFRGGDTVQSAALGPRLRHYDQYTEQMRTGGVTVVAYALLALYRTIFQAALSRASREREFAADWTAAHLTSPQALAQALVKVAAYSCYRQRVENGLFAEDRRHAEELGIGARVAAGLAAFGQSPEFGEAMREAEVPHPFDSHPPMPQRMRAVGHEIASERFAALVCQVPATPWTLDIEGADAIEQRQWRAFERHFAAAHEEDLAYRYVPRTAEEEAVVLRHFPPQQLPLKRGGAVVVDYAGMAFPGKPGKIGFERVRTLSYKDGAFGDVLTIEHPEKGLFGYKRTKVKLPFDAATRQRFKQVLGHYWRRHQIMQSHRLRRT
jgi:Zn-dependent protease with chaperone function